jgi:hypothetical protein
MLVAIEVLKEVGIDLGGDVVAAFISLRNANSVVVRLRL